MLSCMANNNNIYVVASIGAKALCEKVIGCPIDGYYYYSATLVYDPRGRFVSRYFKENMDEHETYLNKPQVSNPTFFDTPFGTVGILSTQDILYEQPTITLIKKLNVSNIVYPTAWKDSLPLMASVEFHSAFAQGMAVNVLAANLHLPSKGYQGSGIYVLYGYSETSSLGGVSCYNNSLTSEGQLLITEVKPGPPNRKQAENKFTRSDLIKRKEETILDNETNEFWGKVNGDRYRMKPLLGEDDNPMICNNDLCCTAKFEGMHTTELFSIGAFSGIHTQNGVYYLESCIFIKCATNETDSCGRPVMT